MEYIENNTNTTINKPQASIIFLGHVDHGKSTICGNILYLLNLVDERQINKLKEEAKKNGMDSWWLAYVMDQCDEEKQKGKTVEVGRGTFETDICRYTILDAPGHKEYIGNTIYALGHTDCAILVTSARSNEFDDGFVKGGQTKEHLLLAKSMGTQKLIVLVNKMDDPSNLWSENKYNQMKSNIMEYIQKTKLGFKDIAFIPISGLLGDNLIKKSDNTKWYTGDTFINTLDSVCLDINKNNGNLIKQPPIFSIMDRFEEGNKLNIMGRLECGSIHKGDKLFVLPSNKLLVVEKICSDFVPSSGEVIKSGPLEHITIVTKLKDITIDDINPGSVLFTDSPSVLPTMEFMAELIMISNSENLHIITSGTQFMMHLKTLQIDVVVKSINNKQFIKKGDNGQVIITTNKPICCSSFAKFKALSRFVLRFDNTTVCVGRITKVKPYKF